MQQGRPSTAKKGINKSFKKKTVQQRQMGCPGVAGSVCVCMSGLQGFVIRSRLSFERVICSGPPNSTLGQAEVRGPLLQGLGNHYRT